MKVATEVGALRDTRTYPRVHGRRLRPKDTRRARRKFSSEKNFLAGRVGRFSARGTCSGIVQRRRLLVREVRQGALRAAKRLST